MSYQAYVVEVKELRKHTNADRLQIATFFGNDVVVGLETNLGDLGVYFPTDGQLSEKFAKENKLIRSEDGYLDDEKRNIKTIKLRGEKSDGLYVPISYFEKFTKKLDDLKVGDTIDVLNGELICQKYVPRGKVSKQNPNQTKGKKVEPKETFPFFEQHIDTSQLAYNMGTFKEGDIITISLKLHGTSQRTAHTLKQIKPNFLKRLLRMKPKTKWDYVTGTRRVTLDSFKGGFYGDNQFRKQWHDKFVGKLHKGEEVYYEVVGYTDTGALIMPECDNKKTVDKEFIKQFGDTTRFTYGCGVGQSDIYVYRMTMTNEDGQVVEYPTDLVRLRCEQMGVYHVPMLEQFIFTTKEDLLERVKKHEEGIDPIGISHIREGVIVRIENRQKFTALKQKNFHFKVLEGIIKDVGVLDMEEENSLT